METIQNFSTLDASDETNSSALPKRTYFYTLLGLGTIFYYIRFGAPVVTNYYLNGVAIPNIHLVIVSLIAILTLMAIGCSIHVRILGGFEKKDIEREVKKEIGKLRNIYSSASTLIAEVEADVSSFKIELSPRGVDTLKTMKKILLALEKRIQVVSSLASTKKLPELCRAVEVLRHKLKATESATTSLIDVDPFPAIMASQIELVIRNLSSELEEFKKMAA